MKVKCMICGKKFTTLGFHLRMIHDISSPEYIKLYPKAKLGKDIWNKNETKETNKSVAKYAKKLEQYTGERNSQYGVKQSAKRRNQVSKSESKTKKEMFENGELEIWNKGETAKTNKSIAAMAKKQTGRKKKKKSIDKMKKTIKEGYDNGRKVWNEGLTAETDARVAAYTKKLNDGRCRRAQIKRVENTVGQLFPVCNKKACGFFNQLNKKYKLIGVHGQNKGEYFIKKLAYWVDYYEPTLNLVIEWNESRHYDKNGRLTNKHIQRQLRIKKKLKCYFINIKEKTFNAHSIYRRVEKIIAKEKNLFSSIINKEIIHNKCGKRIEECKCKNTKIKIKEAK